MPPVIIVQVLWLIAQVVNLYLQIMLDYCLSQEKNLKLLNVLYNLAWDLCVCVCVCVCTGTSISLFTGLREISTSG
jgi:hypothetical protein